MGIGLDRSFVARQLDPRIHRWFGCRRNENFARPNFAKNWGRLCRDLSEHPFAGSAVHLVLRTTRTDSRFWTLV